MSAQQKFVALSLCAVIVGSGAFLAARAPAAQAERLGDLFNKPYQLPFDVFDLPEFNSFRSNGKLNASAAEKFLEDLSDSDLPAAQKLFDITEWKAFIALNWAAKPDGEPDPGAGFENTEARRVWDFWRQTTAIFLPNGAKPADWTAHQDLTLDHWKAAWHTHITANEGKEAFSGPLVDQNGNWLHYTALVDREEFDYIVSNELYNLQGQAAFVQSHEVEFPLSTDTTHGAIEIKLAWKKLTEEEIRGGRFLVRKVPVVIYRYRPAAPAVAAAHVSDSIPKRSAAQLSGRTADNYPSTTPEGTVIQTVGLVGMHITMRTRPSPQWMWATFEQVASTLHLNAATAAGSGETVRWEAIALVPRRAVIRFDVKYVIDGRTFTENNSGRHFLAVEQAS
jgi:hypothetical protein